MAGIVTPIVENIRLSFLILLDGFEMRAGFVGPSTTLNGTDVRFVLPK